MAVTRIGLAVAKNVCQRHSEDIRGQVVARKQLSRGKMLVFFA